jgi:predicted glycosyltransferase
MKRILFYCQYLTGMGHLVRSTEIIRSLAKEFQVCFVNGGPAIENFEIPSGVEIITLPPLWIDKGELQVTAGYENIEEVKESRKNQLINLVDRWRPDCIITEFFPFGRHKLFFELIPLLEHARNVNPATKIVSSVRDIVGRSDVEQEENIILDLLDRYFDLVLYHCDPNFQKLAESFPRAQEISPEVRPTGFVSQVLPEGVQLPIEKPLILASIGGGRIGHELLDTLLSATDLLLGRIPHNFQIFTGPFLDEERFILLQKKAQIRKNVKLDRYTPHLMEYMRQADLSISLTGYNTTMNILKTGVRSLVVPLGHYSKDEEQLIRTRKLETLGIVTVLEVENLTPDRLAEKIITCVEMPAENTRYHFDLEGASKTTAILKELLQKNPSIATYRGYQNSAAKQTHPTISSLSL